MSIIGEGIGFLLLFLFAIVFSTVYSHTGKHRYIVEKYRTYDCGYVDMFSRYHSYAKRTGPNSTHAFLHQPKLYISKYSNHYPGECNKDEKTCIMKVTYGFYCSEQEVDGDGNGITCYTRTDDVEFALPVCTVHQGVRVYGDFYYLGVDLTGQSSLGSGKYTFTLRLGDSYIAVDKCKIHGEQDDE